MLMKFDQVVSLIENGKLLHIASTEDLLKKLPKGRWIGGSTEYFMAQTGGTISDELLFVTEFPYENHKVKVYDSDNINMIASDAFDSGFSILIIPFDSDVHKEYAKKAPTYKDMFIKVLVGWISGLNLGKAGQTPIAVDGSLGEAFSDKAVALHLEVPADKVIDVNIVNIFKADDNSPIINFIEEGFTATKCLIDGAETQLADYISSNEIDTKLPLVGNYSGTGVNVSFRGVEDGVVNFYAPVFNNIEYRFAKDVPDYVEAFQSSIDELKDSNAVFSCNCVLNFLYGELEGKNIKAFAGPITFGEIAFQLVNQTLVYISVR
jgi:hypothetical protein